MHVSSKNGQGRLIACMGPSVLSLFRLSRLQIEGPKNCKPYMHKQKYRQNAVCSSHILKYRKSLSTKAIVIGIAEQTAGEENRRGKPNKSEQLQHKALVWSQGPGHQQRPHHPKPRRPNLLQAYDDSSDTCRQLHQKFISPK